jgi:hypothetical protein
MAKHGHRSMNRLQKHRYFRESHQPLSFETSIEVPRTETDVEKNWSKWQMRCIHCLVMSHGGVIITGNRLSEKLVQMRYNRNYLIWPSLVFSQQGTVG